MSNHCANYRRCSATERYLCEAYLQNRNCWEVRSIPCCQRRNKDRCESCVVYIACGRIGVTGLPPGSHKILAS